MAGMDSIFEHQWLIFSLLLFGFIAYTAWQRYRDRQWIARTFPGRPPLVQSFGITCFETTGPAGSAREHKGLLVLFPDRLVFFSRRKKRKIDLPGPAITGVRHDTGLKGEDLGRSLMVVEFTNETGAPDAAAYRVPYPPQWIKAVQSLLDHTRADRPPEE